MENHSEKYNDGYRWYVYVPPDTIQYFATKKRALEYAEHFDCEVSELRI